MGHLRWSGRRFDLRGHDGNDGHAAVGSDADLALVIKNGAAQYGGSAMMMPNPTLSDADVTLLVAYIRSLKK